MLVVCCCCIVLQMKTDCSPQISLPWFMAQSGSQLPLQAPSVMETSYIKTKKHEKTNKMNQMEPKNLVVESGMKWSTKYYGKLCMRKIWFLVSCVGEGEVRKDTLTLAI